MFASISKVVEIVPFGSKHRVTAALRTMAHGGGKSHYHPSGPIAEVLDRDHKMLVKGLPCDYDLT